MAWNTRIAARTGVVYAFRGSATDDKTHTFRLYGLEPSRQYRLHYQDGSSTDRVESGRDLRNNGIHLTLTIPNSSELVFIDEVR